MRKSSPCIGRPLTVTKILSGSAHRVTCSVGGEIGNTLGYNSKGVHCDFGKTLVLLSHWGT